MINLLPLSKFFFCSTAMQISLNYNCSAPRTGKGQEVHAAAGPAEAARPGDQLHVQAPHVRHLQSGGQKRLQGLQG